MAERGQSPSCVALSRVELNGSQLESFEEKGPSIAEDKHSASSLERCKEKKSIKDTRGLLEQIILKHAVSKGIINSPDATDEEKATISRRILNDKRARWRNIFSQWPRDPKGKCITPLTGNSPNALANGKMVHNTNVQLWGATLFDFYSVKPLPESIDLAFSSGSKLAAWMKDNGEDHAKNQLEFAENEDDPYLIPPYEITGLIQDTDREYSTSDEKGWIRDEQDVDVNGTREKENTETEYWRVPQPVGLSSILFFSLRIY